MKRLLVGLAAWVALTGGSAAGQEAIATPEQPPPAATASLAAEDRAQPRVAPEPPEHLRMAEISAPVVPLAMNGSTLTPPSDPAVLGWWGRRAGADHGVTLLVGHTVHTGGGELDDLEDVPRGATATVDGRHYTVRSNKVISKDSLARRASRLFSQTGPHRLVIVTCEDYDPATGHYRSNVVLTATPH